MPTDLLPDAVVRYADHEDGVLDLHLPEHPNGVTVLLVHGGFWKTAYDRTHTRPMARALAEAGFVVATPEYRRVGPGGTGGWPVTADDVRRAAGALPELLGRVGVEAGTLRAAGHSAGGHLVLWLATTDVARDLALDRVVALAPVCDLGEAIRLGLGSDAAVALLGDADPGPADPMLLLDARPDTDIRVLHGADDDTVPIGLARGLAARHPWVTLTELPSGHYELIEPGSGVWSEVLAALAD